MGGDLDIRPRLCVRVYMERPGSRQAVYDNSKTEFLVHVCSGRA